MGGLLAKKVAIPHAPPSRIRWNRTQASGLPGPTPLVELRENPDILASPPPRYQREPWGLGPCLTPVCLSGRNDEKTAADYKIQGGSVLHLVLALRGGGLR